MPDINLSILQDRSFLLVGGGKMGSALLHGWLTSGLSPSQFMVQEPNPDEALQTKGVILNPDLSTLAAPDIIVLAIKPQMALEVIPVLAEHLDADTIVISLLAGTRIANLQALLSRKTGIIRTMPNTPAEIGASMTALCAGAGVDATARMQAEVLMQAVGKTVWLDDEDYMDAVTAIGGSGPAYLFYLVEALKDSGEALGLSPEIADLLARQTIIGSARMLDESDETASRLRGNVTSPGGTTQAALNILVKKKGGLIDLMRRATKAAAKRSRDLSEAGREDS